jgi:hypothetical protein
MFVKRVVCLANSRKLADRCIAGREWIEGRSAGDWVRPVSGRETQGVSEYERQYEDGSDPQVLDIVDIPLLEAQPQHHQTENWLLDPKYYWEKAGRLSPMDLPALEDPVAPLWIDGYSTYKGRNDKIPITAIASVADSLRLIRIERLQLVVCRPGEAFGNNKRRVQGRFRHAELQYALWVTDPGYEKKYLSKLDGTYDLGDCYVTVSLGETYQDACHKLIATIIEVD